VAPGAERPLAAVEAANAELVAAETSAFASVRLGQAPEAWKSLNNTEYQAAKQRYSDALTSFITHLDAHQHKLLAQAAAETKLFVVLAAIAALVILLLIVVGGWGAFRLLGRA
jgi:nitrate/nitrite-specific signal transduction histidine kinase